MSGISSTQFNLPWNQHERYRIALYAKGDGFPPPLLAVLTAAGLQAADERTVSVEAPRNWKPVWDGIYGLLANSGAVAAVEASVTAMTAIADRRDSRPVPAIQHIAESLWLGDALIEERIMCYLQPVVSAREKIFGYESFARVRSSDGSVIAGDRIVAASHALGIQHVIDRHLQVQAIRTFVSSEFNGFLFVNFFPGFIQRPAVYLEGLSETARNFGVIAKHIVLDFTRSEMPRDITHLKSVCEYGRSRGYSIALDDVESVEVAKKLLPEIRPDFVKIDMRLARQAADPAARNIIRRLVELAHAGSSTVIGEGIETEDIYQALRQLGVDLFQGYLFAPPMPIEAALKRSAG
ncbi:MAG: EAL domain-containing protein [Pseudomonadota bacterium]|nr:EAL domain-containing protein [Pseudomonadota bacterium]